MIDKAMLIKGVNSQMKAVNGTPSAFNSANRVNNESFGLTCRINVMDRTDTNPALQRRAGRTRKPPNKLEDYVRH